jgi:acyl-CoA dehydrogenase
VFVPEEHLLGDEGRGFYLIMANFQWERLAMALGAIGSMRAGLERAIPRLAGRGQAVRHVVAELATVAYAGEALTYQALRRFLDGGDAVREVTMAKLATQRASFDLHDRLLSLLGPDPELERAARDARLGPIGGGTDEIMREILGRTL